MTKISQPFAGFQQVRPLRLAPAITSRPLFLSGEAVGLPCLSPAARTEIELARADLRKWEDAFDRNTKDADEYHKEIRVAERRLRSALRPEQPIDPSTAKEGDRHG